MKAQPTYTTLLENILQEVVFAGGALMEGAGEALLDAYWERAEKRLGGFPPAGYYEFLRRTNGLRWADVTICYVHDPQSHDPNLNQVHAAAELLAFNEHYRSAGLPEGYILWGFNDEGLFACRFKQETFAQLDSQSFRVLKSHETFTDFLHEALEGLTI